VSPIALEAGRGTQDWQGRVQTRVGALLAAGFHTRLLARDDSLWGADAERRKVAKTRLGWLESPQSMRDRAPDFTAFADEVRRDGFTRVLLLGMGGSSLAPETLVHIFGTRPGGLPLTVLDDTSPGCVRWAEGLADPARTLVLVSSKSGGTIEVSSFEQAFWARAQAVLGSDTGRSFVAITDPGTPLAARAVAKRYRRVFENPPDIGGRS